MAPQIFVKGDRVGCIADADSLMVHYIGVGVYEGECVPPEGTVGKGPAMHRHREKCGKIKLDDGQVLYSCECWFGTEEKVRDFLAKGKRTLHVVTIGDVRRNPAMYDKVDNACI